MEKQSNTTQMHANPSDAGKGQTAPVGWPCALALQHCVSATQRGKELLAKQQPCPGSSSAHSPCSLPRHLRTRSRRRAGFPLFCPPSLSPSLPQNEHSKPRQLAKSSLPASPAHVDPHLPCPAVMEPGLRAALRRTHAPRSIRLCVSKGGDSIFRAQLSGTVRLTACLRGVGTGEVWR